jgi:stage II sporulation protein D
VIPRKAFLVLGAAAAAAAAAPAWAGAQDDADPATMARSPGLRVLLGPGRATPLPGGGFDFEGRSYRGSFAQSAAGVVNLVDLEQYLYSVVPHEMSAGWPVAALAAQAVCARTYVLQRSSPKREYDLRPSEADQVYGGIATESPAGRAAVDSTAGQVLRFGGGAASVAYSSCCGGHTESSADAWGAAPLPYLQGVVCTACSASPNYRWSTAVPFDSIEAGFGGQLGAFGALRDVRITGTDPSGRARGFDLVADRGVLPVKGSAFRLGVGARVVRSLLITRLTQANGSIAIEGGGLGHGVGLCQWGARGMALAGRSANDILTFYFPGTEIGND